MTLTRSQKESLIEQLIEEGELDPVQALIEANNRVNELAEALKGLIVDIEYIGESDRCNWYSKAQRVLLKVGVK